MSNKRAAQLCSGWFFLHILLFVLSVIFDDPFIDTFQPQSLTVQVSGSWRCPGHKQSPRQTQILPKQGELSVTLYSFGQAGGKGVERFVYLCVDLNRGCVRVFT